MINYQDPNLTYAALFIGARIAPWEVEANPALDLLSLEEPMQYDLLRALLVEGWREAGVQALPAKYQRLYACDCAERVLHLYEAKYPDDRRPRTAIEVARRFAMELASAGEMQAAREEAGEAVYDALMEADFHGEIVWNWLAETIAGAAATNVMEAGAWGWALWVRGWTQGQSEKGISEVRLSAEETASERREEKRWQAGVVRQYYEQYKAEV